MRIPELAWGMLLAPAPGLSVQQQSQAAACESYFAIGAVPGCKDWPLLFDPQHRPKKAFWKVVR